MAISMGCILDMEMQMEDKDGLCGWYCGDQQDQGQDQEGFYSHHQKQRQQASTLSSVPAVDVDRDFTEVCCILLSLGQLERGDDDFMFYYVEVSYFI